MNGLNLAKNVIRLFSILLYIIIQAVIAENMKNTVLSRGKSALTIQRIKNDRSCSFMEISLLGVCNARPCRGF
jgi:hypothetical protein